MIKAKHVNVACICGQRRLEFFLRNEAYVSSNRYVWFDLIRGLSALVVCASHLRAVVLIDYPLIESPRLFDKLLYALTGLGHQAVMVFFVLSGFFVGSAVIKGLSVFQWHRYATARLARLWAVLIPALIFTYAVDQMMAAMVPNATAGVYQPIWHSGPMPGEYTASAGTFVGNALFLQTLWVPVFGTNGPLWSLANEFWYYVTFPLLALALDRSRTWPRRTGFALCGLAVLVAMPSEMRYGFCVWLMGAGAYGLVHRWPSVVSRWGHQLLWPALVLFVLALAYSKAGSVQSASAIADLLIGATFTIFCIGLLARERQSKKMGGAGWLSRFARALSEISYSLYLSHFPVVVFVGAVLFVPARLPPTLMSTSILLILMLCLVALGSMFWWLFERHTSKLRSLLALTAQRLSVAT